MREFQAGGHGRGARIIRLLCRIFVRPTLTIWPVRGPLAPGMGLVDLVHRPVPRLAETELRTVRGGRWRAELVTPERRPARPGAIIYFHGGAFVFCGLATHRRIVERLALRTGMPVLSVDYRQHPVGRLADALDDAADAARWLGDYTGGEPLVFVGDSAGGFLAFQLALQAAARGVAKPVGVVGLSPWLDMDPAAKQAHPNARTDVFLPARRFPEIARLMAGDDDGVVDSAQSPVNGPLSSLPPVLLHCAAEEVMRVDAELMADRLRARGVPHRLKVWEGQVHCFPVLGNILPESRAALAEIADFVLDVVDGARAQAG